MSDLILSPREIVPVHFKVPAVNRLSPSFSDVLNLRYNEKSLLEMINLALNKNTLESVVNAIENDKSLKNIKPESTESNPYLAKILREEIKKQFSEGTRPLVELVSNAIDARPLDHEGIYVVGINVGEDYFEVTDNGKGMDLRKILNTLIIPFSSDKEILENIGNFGIGFFSSLQYCLKKYHNSKVNVTTNNGDKAYNIRLRSKGENVEDLIIGIKSIKPKTEGTTVRVSSITFQKSELERYLKKYLEFFDPRRAVITIDKKPVNINRTHTPAYKEYYLPLKFEYKGVELEQNCRVGIDILDNENGNIGFYSQGIFVQSRDLKFGRVCLDLPSSVRLVEGRDEFKRNSNYYKCTQGAFNVLIKYGEDSKDNIYVLRALREILPAFVQEFMDDRRDNPLIKEDILHVCFPEKSYLVKYDENHNQLIDLIDFFGNNILSKIYVPRTNIGFHFWRHLIQDTESLINDHTNNKHSIRKDLIARKLGDTLSNKNPIYDSSYAVSLNEHIKTRSPVLVSSNEVYVNLNHPLFKEESYIANYGFRTYFLRQKLGDKGIETRIIEGALYDGF